MAKIVSLIAIMAVLVFGALFYARQLKPGQSLVPSKAEKAYTWVDDKGSLHYGDTAPEGVDAREVTIQPAPAVRVSVPQPHANGSSKSRPEISLPSINPKELIDKAKEAQQATLQRAAEERKKIDQL